MAHLQIGSISFGSTFECQTIQVRSVSRPYVYTPVFTATCNDNAHNRLLRCRNILHRLIHVSEYYHSRWKDSPAVNYSQSTICYYSPNASALQPESK